MTESRNMKPKILVAEDDDSVLSYLEPMLRRASFEVVVARDGEQALRLADQEQPDLVVLDILMPRMDGRQVCLELRKRDRHIPIIMLTVLDDPTEAVKVLTMGADHYFRKPGNPHELIAQIEATLRTVRASQGTARRRLVFDLMEIDLDRRRVWVASQETDLTPKEFDLLCALAQQPGKVFGRETLLETVWGINAEVESRVVDTTIAEIRRKLEPNRRVPRYILTERGIGYRFRD
jgi:DNA-binding response OmpR family regulator